MKKYALFLIGMCALVLTSVIFAACEKKDSDKLVGTWKCTEMYYNQVTYVLTFNKDNTGTYTLIDSSTGETYTINSTFDYTYDSKSSLLKMHMSYYSEYYDEWENASLAYQVNWYGDNKIYLGVYYDGYVYDDEEWGPFIRQ